MLKSSVVPEGTATSDKIIVEHDCCDLLALEAPLEPEKVQLVALFSKLGASVIAGSATGEENTDAANEAIARAVTNLYMANFDFGYACQNCDEVDKFLLRTSPGGQYIFGGKQPWDFQGLHSREIGSW